MTKIKLKWQINRGQLKGKNLQIVSGTNVDLHKLQTKLINEKFCTVPSVLWFDCIQHWYIAENLSSTARAFIEYFKMISNNKAVSRQKLWADSMTKLWRQNVAVPCYPQMLTDSLS